MKTRSILLSLLLIGLCAQVNGQYNVPVYSSFHADPKGVFWLKGFDQPGFSSEALRETMLAHLEKNDVVQHLKVDHFGNLIATIENMKIDYRKLGVSFINTSNKISNGRWKGKIKIDFSDGKYRISIYHLEYVAKMHYFAVPKVQGLTQREYEKGTLSNSFLNDDKHFFKNSCLKDLDLMNIIFIDQFSLIPERIFNPDSIIESASF